MIILDNIAKQYGVDENFQPFTEKVQVLFDTLKESREGLIRAKKVDTLLVCEKEIDGLSGVLSEEPLTEELEALFEEAFKVDEPIIEEGEITDVVN